MTSVRTIRVEPDSEIARFLRSAESESLLVVLEDATYRVDKVELSQHPLFQDYDAGTVQRALRASAGILQTADRIALKSMLRKQRGQDSSGRPADPRALPD